MSSSRNTESLRRKSPLPAITVLMPVYNGERYVGEAIESVLRQTHDRFELLIIDDGSTDSTPEILDRYAARDPRIRVLHQTNIDQPATLNRGLELATHEWVAIMDHDDVCLPDRLERELEVLEREPEARLIGTWAVEINAEGHELRLRGQGPTTVAEFRKWDADGKRVPLVHPSVLMHRSTILQLGGYDPDFSSAADSELWTRVARHHPIVVVPEPLMLYRIHRASMSFERIFEQRERLRWIEVRDQAMRSGAPVPSVAALRADRRSRLLNLWRDVSWLLSSNHSLALGEGRHIAATGWALGAAAMEPSRIVRRVQRSFAWARARPNELPSKGAVRGERAVIRALAPIRRWHPRILPAMTAIGIVCALLEGVGLSLFLPFLYSIDAGTFAPTPDSLLGQAFHRALSMIPQSHRLLTVSVSIVVLISLKNVFMYANAALDSWTRTLLVHSVRTRIVDQLLRTRSDYTESRETGRLVNVLQNQTLELGRAFSSHAQILVNASTAAVFGVFLVLVSWQLALGVGVALALISSLLRLAWRRSENQSPIFVKAWDELSQRGLELLQGMRTIQLFGREAYERERFGRASHEASSIWFRLDLLSGMVRPASEILVVGVVVAALLATLRGASSIPTVLTFALILWRLRPQIQGMDVARAQLLAARASVNAVMALLDPGDKPTLASGTVPFRGIGDSIRFEAVSYRHPGSDRDSLHDVSLAIPAGRTTAVLGLSGAGKSTLVQLLLRVTDPDRGRVLVDGVALPELDLASWRRGTALVTHDPVLFNSTVRDNIAYGREGASPDDVARAARRAGVDDFIEHLPDGYDGIVGDRGARLSAGQRQRIALARALLREPRLIVLDEATSALDATAEKNALEAVESFGDGATVVFISHRRAVVERADHFVLLDEGRVVAEGDRSALDGIAGAVRGLYGTDTLEDRTPPRH